MSQNASGLPLSTVNFAIGRYADAGGPSQSYTITAPASPGSDPNSLAFLVSNPTPTQQQAGLMVELVVMNYHGPALYTLYGGGEFGTGNGNFAVWVGTAQDFWDLKMTPSDNTGFVSVVSDAPTMTPGIYEVRGNFDFRKLAPPGFGGALMTCVGDFDVFLQR